MEAGKRSKNPVYFLTKEEQEAIVKAIKDVESFSTTEIRLHIAKKIKGDIIKEAEKVFYSLGMQNTAERTGVLFFFSIKDRKFAIIGDKGIYEKAGSDFWLETAKKMEDYFKRNLFGEGIVSGIYEIGNILKEYFPYKEGDINELPDEISFE
ncbi:MAG: TPM domain-containing protein [Brevinematia bacterium]